MLCAIVPVAPLRNHYVIDRVPTKKQKQDSYL